MSGIYGTLIGVEGLLTKIKAANHTNFFTGNFYPTPYCMADPISTTLSYHPIS